MKRIKLVLLMLICFTLCGCSVKYNVEITGSSVKEEISIPLGNESLPTNMDFYYDLNGQKKYDYKVKNGNLILFNKNSSITTLVSNDLYDFCFDNISLLEENGVYYISTSKKFECLMYEYLNVDSIELNIKTYNKVIETNASKHGNTYTWKITKDNENDSQIYLAMKKNEYVWYYRFKDIWIGLSIVAGILLFGYIIYYIFKKISDYNNRR